MEKYKPHIGDKFVIGFYKITRTILELKEMKQEMGQCE
jgi:hypothetical protein